MTHRLSLPLPLPHFLGVRLNFDSITIKSDSSIFYTFDVPSSIEISTLEEARIFRELYERSMNDVKNIHQFLYEKLSVFDPGVHYYEKNQELRFMKQDIFLKVVPLFHSDKCRFIVHFGKERRIFENYEDMKNFVTEYSDSLSSSVRHHPQSLIDRVINDTFSYHRVRYQRRMNAGDDYYRFKWETSIPLHEIETSLFLGFSVIDRTDEFQNEISMFCSKSDRDYVWECIIYEINEFMFVSTKGKTRHSCVRIIRKEEYDTWKKTQRNKLRLLSVFS